MIAIERGWINPRFNAEIYPLKVDLAAMRYRQIIAVAVEIKTFATKLRLRGGDRRVAVGRHSMVPRLVFQPIIKRHVQHRQVVAGLADGCCCCACRWCKICGVFGKVKNSKIVYISLKILTI